MNPNFESPFSSLYSRTSSVQNGMDCYWYHSDHLGSSSWITYSNGKAVEHLHYMPWGEDFVRQRNTDFHARYTFSAKGKDAETGYSYFGARYYSSDLGIWLSVDPMSDKYPSMSPYAYCADNPVKLVDPNGEEAGPIDRILAARLFLGTSYKQETETENRTLVTSEALENVDCSELVCRVLAADNITSGVKHKNTAGLKTMLNDGGKYIKSKNPQIGDIALWKGHTGIVSDVDKGGKIKLVHAKGIKYGVVEEEAFQTVEEITTRDFEGFFRPVNETPDGKEDLRKNHPVFLKEVIVSPNENKNQTDENSIR